MSRGESIVLIAEDRNRVAIGFVQLFGSFSSVLAVPIYVLGDLFVMPTARRRGVGTLLLKAAAETSRISGVVQMELATAITNVSAQRLYETLGWKRDEEFRVYSLSIQA